MKCLRIPGEEVSREFDVISKPKNVCHQKQKRTSFVINYRLWSEFVGMDWNLKNVRLMFFKFSHFCFQNVLEQISCSSFQ